MPERHQQDRGQRGDGPLGADRWLKSDLAKWEVGRLQYLGYLAWCMNAWPGIANRHPSGSKMKI